MAKFISSLSSKRIYIDKKVVVVNFPNGVIETSDKALIKALQSSKNVVEVKDTSGQK